MTALALLSLLVLSSVSWTGTDARYSISDSGKPISYELHLQPNIMENKFNGTVTIDFVMTKSSYFVELHQMYLVVKTVELIGNTILSFHTNNMLGILEINCQNVLVIDNSYRLKIEYSSMLSNTKRGFYRTRYVNDDETKWIAVTHFEPTGARMAFPCWDEPIYKATFNISITHLKNYTAVLSNMPVSNKTDNGDDTITTYFERTPEMSPYLVAVIVSDYAYISDPSNKFRIYTKPDSIQHTEYAMKFSVKAINQLDLYTGLPYLETMPKMDQVTIVDFIDNAMENWALVIYREVHLLIEEGVTPLRVKQDAATTIAHEIAHQWFGNLVTPTWWEFLWLKEGLATYFQYYITDKAEPTWRFKDLFAVEAMQWGAFISDGELEAHAMHKPVTRTSEIFDMVDDIAYRKAGSVIRMFSHVLTEEVFQTALQNYLKAYSFETADPGNLIRHFQDAAGENKLWGGVNLWQIAHTWFSQPGYPVVTVKKISPGHYSLSQRRFLYYETNNKLRWWIPISYATNINLSFADTTPTHWMNPKEEDLTILETKADWILVNKQQTGYYRVNYDDEILQSLSKYLKSNIHHIHPVNRAQLIDDSMIMARYNFTKYETALSLTLYLTHEIDYIPWMTAFKHLDYWSDVIFPSKHYHMFKHYLRYIMRGLTKKMTYEASSKDDHPTKILKAHAMKWGCLMADIEECVDYARKEFNAWLYDPNHRLDIDLADTIVCTGLRTASEEVWDDVLEKLSESVYDINVEKSPLEVMGCSTNHTILEKFLVIASAPDTDIKFELAVRGIIANSNVSGVEIVLQILESARWRLVEMHDVKYISNSATAIASAIMDNQQYLRLCKLMFYGGTSKDLRKSTQEQMKKNIERISTFEHIIYELLASNETFFSSSGTNLTFASFLLIFSIFMTRYY